MEMEIDYPLKRASPEVEDVILPTRKKIKTSDLPLNAQQRNTIDNLVHLIKKKGIFDTLRKKAYSGFDDSVRRDEQDDVSKMKCLQTGVEFED